MKKFILVFLMSLLFWLVVFDHYNIKGERVLTIASPSTWVKLWTVTGYTNAGGRNYSFWTKASALERADDMKPNYPLVRLTWEPSGEEWTLKDRWDEYMEERGKIIWLDLTKSGVSGWR